MHSSQDRVKTLTFRHLVGARWLSARRTAGTSVTNHAGHTMVVVSQESAYPHCTVVVAGGWLVKVDPSAEIRGPAHPLPAT